MIRSCCKLGGTIVVKPECEIIVKPECEIIVKSESEIVVKQECIIVVKLEWTYVFLFQSKELSLTSKHLNIS